MPQKVKCPGGHEMTVPSQRVGMSVRCPICRATFKVPQPQPPMPPPSATTSAAVKKSSSQEEPGAESRRPLPTEQQGPARSPLSPAERAARARAKQAAAKRAAAKQAAEKRARQVASKAARDTASNRDSASAKSKSAAPRSDGPAAAGKQLTESKPADVAKRPDSDRLTRSSPSAPAEQPTAPRQQKTQSTSSSGDADTIAAARLPDPSTRSPAQKPLVKTPSGSAPANAKRSAGKKPLGREVAASAPEPTAAQHSPSAKPTPATSSKPRTPKSTSRQARTHKPAQGTTQRSDAATKRTDKSVTPDVAGPAKSHVDAQAAAGQPSSADKPPRTPPPLAKKAEPPGSSSKVESAKQSPAATTDAQDKPIHLSKHEPSTTRTQVAAPTKAPPPLRPQPPAESKQSRGPKQPPEWKPVPAASAAPTAAEAKRPEQREERRVQGVTHDLGKRWSAYYLAIGLVVVGLFNMSPAVYNMVSTLRNPSAPPMPSWTFGTLVVGTLLLIYAVYLVQLPDWSSVWVVAILSLVLTTFYSIFLGIVTLGNAQNSLIVLLELDMVEPRQKVLWCLSMVSISALLTYFCGRLAVRWHRSHQITIEALRRN